MTIEELKAHVAHAPNKRCKFEHITWRGFCVNCGFRPDRARKDG